MRNISIKTQKWIVTGCLSIVCVVLVAAIYSRFKTEPIEDDEVKPSSVVSEERDPAPGLSKTDESPEKKNEIIVKPIQTIPLLNEIPIQQNANEPEQSHTPEAVKLEVPAKPNPQGEITDPSKSPEYKPEDTTVAQPPEAKPDEKKDSQIYVPGFGWQKETGGQGTQVGSDGDINKQVGSMD